MAPYVCKTCRFLVVEERSIGGEYGNPKIVTKYNVFTCHAHPPVVVSIGTDEVFEWPTVNPDDFCGEHAAHELKEEGRCQTRNS